MTKKEILRKVWLVLSWLYLFYITAKFLLGKADTLTTVCMFICYSISVLYFIVLIISKIIHKVNDCKIYKSLEKGLEYLQAVYKERYKLYFTGDKEKIEEYSAEIERYGNAMLNAGESAISNNLLSKKHVTNVKEILNQTKEMIAN